MELEICRLFRPKRAAIRRRSSILRGTAREIVVVNRDRKRAKAVVTDLQYGAALSSVVQIRDGDYSDLTSAALVIITVGMNEKAGGSPMTSRPR